VRDPEADAPDGGGATVSEVLVQFAELATDESGRSYLARACGSPIANDTRWQGWLEFVPVDGGPTMATGRETTQPNRADTEYWATGLTPVYRDGALQRALHPLRLTPEPPLPSPAFDAPRE
jgi:hypothetical protein